MLQREFAERMVARAGTKDYGRLSVGVYYRADCKIMIDVPRTAFWPQPKVDSCVVRLVPRDPPFEVVDEEAFFEVTKVIFSHRRKKIMNSLALRGHQLDARFLRAPLDTLPYGSKRPEELSPEMIGELTNAILDPARLPPEQNEDR